MRERLPATRPSITRRFEIKYVDDLKRARSLAFYVIVGMYEDYRPAEIFIHTSRKEGDGDQIAGLISGVLDTVGTAISIGLQYGAPVEVFISKLRNHRFGPAGFTGDGHFPSCTSMFDLMAQWLSSVFPNGKYQPKG